MREERLSTYFRDRTFPRFLGVLKYRPKKVEAGGRGIFRFVRCWTTSREFCLYGVSIRRFIVYRASDVTNVRARYGAQWHRIVPMRSFLKIPIVWRWRWLPILGSPNRGPYGTERRYQVNSFCLTIYRWSNSANPSIGLVVGNTALGFQQYQSTWGKTILVSYHSKILVRTAQC